MIRPLSLFFFIYFASIFKDGNSWSITIKPESGHIRVNKTTTIMCRTSELINVDDCKFKIDNRETMEFRRGIRTPKIVVNHNGKPLYTAKYSGRGLEYGHCGLSLWNIAAGVYVVGCQLRDAQGSVRQEFMTLNVDNNPPLKVRVNRRYQTAAPGSEVAVLCSTEKRQPLDHCAIRLPSKEWVLFQQGHQSKETEHYHYHGRGLDKGHCGVNLVNVTEGDSGMVLCHVRAGLKSSVRAFIVKVADPKPKNVISWSEKPHLQPGDLLEAECVMKGAYPLPPMIWHFQSRILNRSEVEDSTQKFTFRWPWEDHIIRQKVAVRVGSRLGMKTLTCSADEAGELSKSPLISKFTNSIPNEILVPVIPRCGIRTSSIYDTASKRKRIIKRDTKPTAKDKGKPGEAALYERTEKPPTSTSTASQSASGAITSNGTLPAEDADYEEPVWDEIDSESGSRWPAVPAEDEVLEMPPATGVVGGQPVFEAPVQKPSPWMRGGNPVFNASDKQPVEKLPESIDFETDSRRPAHGSHEVAGMMGGIPVIMNIEEVTMVEVIPILPTRAPRPVVPPDSITGGHTILGTPVFGIKRNRSDTGSFHGHEIFESVGGIEVLKEPRPQSAGGTEVFKVPTRPGTHQSIGGKEVLNLTDTEIVFDAFPWTAGIYKKIKDKYTQQCGGTLVTETHVICAAHCFWDEKESIPTLPEHYKVALGKVFRDWDIGDALVQRRSVRQLHIHPVFRGRKRNFQHDISVIELEDKVHFTSRVAPACIDWDNDLEDRQLKDGNSGVVTGWGYTEDEKPSDILRYVELPYVDANSCYDRLPQDMQLLLTTDKFCAGVSKGNTSVCPGDSGGGLLFLDDLYGVYFLRGIVSVAFRPPSFVGKCYYSEVSGFTLVSSSLPWLKKIMHFDD